MAKISRKEKKKQKVIFYAALFFVFLMATSLLAGFYGGGNDDLGEYNGFKFKSTNNGVSTKIDGDRMNFFYHPSILEYINISSDVKELLSKPSITLTFDPEDKYISGINWGLENLWIL